MKDKHVLLCNMGSSKYGFNRFDSYGFNFYVLLFVLVMGYGTRKLGFQVPTIETEPRNNLKTMLNPIRQIICRQYRGTTAVLPWRRK